MIKKVSIMKIITDYNLRVLPLFVICYLLFASPVQAVNVSNIDIIPASPTYGEMFECVLTLDYDENDLACDMLALSDPNTKKPWDICPKINERALGHRYTSGNQRHYNCVADSSTGVPGPGTYRVVAWRFYSDGAYGDVIAEKQITIVDKPPPTVTPFPTKKPISTPTRKPVPTVTLKPSPTSVVPTITIPPIYNPPAYQANPTIILYPTASLVPSPREFKPLPTEPVVVGFMPIRDDISNLRQSGDSGIPGGEILKKFQTTLGQSTETIYGMGRKTFESGSNFIVNIFINFFNETSF